MKENISKSIITSLLVTNIWTIIAFFTYFYDEPGWFYGLQTLLFYMWSCWIASALGILVIIMSFLKYRVLSKNQKLFTLVMVTVLNSYYTILLILLVIQNLIRGEAIFELFLIANLMISIVGIWRFKKIRKSYCVE